MDNHPVGVFDSGVGGLSILSAIQKLLPLENTIYLADQAYMPYGAKGADKILERAIKIVSFFQKKKAKAVVIACNTATIAAVERLRQVFDFPIIGTVPVVKTAANYTKTGRIAIFATPATCKSLYLDDLVAKFAKGKTVLKVGESHLEDLIEEGNIDSSQVEVILREQLDPLIKENVDAIALGCTHYPFVKFRIEEIVGSKIKVFDSGGAIARRVSAVLEKESLLSTQRGADLYYTTGSNVMFEDVVKKLLNKKIEASHINL